MKKLHLMYSWHSRCLLMLALIAIGSQTSYCQDSTSIVRRKALNIPFRKYGLSIGNSNIFNGLRLNAIDSNVEKINGVNFGGWARDYGENEVLNGMNFGLIPSTKLSNGITIGLYGTGGNRINGLSYGTVAVGSKEINGISIAGFVNSSAGNISGIAVAGITIFSHKSINGIAFSIPAIITDVNINGMAIDLGCIVSKNEIRGAAVTAGYLNTVTLRGVSISGFSRSESIRGLSIALVNYTMDLKGFQVGLLNYAGNNRKGFKWLPLINAHLRK